MYYSEVSLQRAFSANESLMTQDRMLMEVGDVVESTEINEAQECLKCGGDRDCHHMESQKVNSQSIEDKENDEYWAGILAEKNENRNL